MSSKLPLIAALVGSLALGAPEADPHSYSRPTEVTIRATRLDLTVDFDKKILTGSATFTIENLTKAKVFVLDTKNLSIRQVTAHGKDLRFQLGKEDRLLGQALTIDLGDEKPDEVTVKYRTKPGAEALTWLTPKQTISKKPFLFTLSEPIGARTWMPCLDTPSVRAPYTATIRVPRRPKVASSPSAPRNDSGGANPRYEEGDGGNAIAIHDGGGATTRLLYFPDGGARLAANGCSTGEGEIKY